MFPHLVSLPIGVGSESERGTGNGAAAGHDKGASRDMAAHVLLQGRRHLCRENILKVALQVVVVVMVVVEGGFVSIIVQ